MYAYLSPRQAENYPVKCRRPWHRSGQSTACRTGIDPAAIDEVIMGCVCQPADESTLGDQSALRHSPIVPAVPCTGTVLPDLNPSPRAAEKLPLAEEISFWLAGSKACHRSPCSFQNLPPKFGQLAKSRTLGSRLRALTGFRPKDFSPVPALLKGLTDSTCNMGMGQTAELLAGF